MLVHAFAEIASLLLLSATSEEVGDPFRGLDREEVLALIDRFIQDSA